MKNLKEVKAIVSTLNAIGNGNTKVKTFVVENLENNRQLICDTLNYIYSISKHEEECKKTGEMKLKKGADKRINTLGRSVKENSDNTLKIKFDRKSKTYSIVEHNAKDKKDKSDFEKVLNLLDKGSFTPEQITDLAELLATTSELIAK